MRSGKVRFEEVVPGRTRVDVTMNYAQYRRKTWILANRERAIG